MGRMVYVHPCSKCHGSGDMTCEHCGGDGYDYYGGQCEYCYGTGEVTCTECDGSGEVESD